MKKKTKKKLTDLGRMLEHHKRSCYYYVWSSDRHCSCGRDGAIVQLKTLLGEDGFAKAVGEGFGQS